MLKPLAAGAIVLLSVCISVFCFIDTGKKPDVSEQHGKLESRVDTLESEFNVYKTELDAKIKKVNDELDKVRSESKQQIDKMKTDKVENKKQIEKVNQEIKIHQGQVVSISS